MNSTPASVMNDSGLESSVQHVVASRPPNHGIACSGHDRTPLGTTNAARTAWACQIHAASNAVHGRVEHVATRSVCHDVGQVENPSPHACSVQHVSKRPSCVESRWSTPGHLAGFVGGRKRVRSVRHGSQTVTAEGKCLYAGGTTQQDSAPDSRFFRRPMWFPEYAWEIKLVAILSSWVSAFLLAHVTDCRREPEGESGPQSESLGQQSIYE